MILWARRELKILSGYHYLVIFLTILLPVIGPTSFAFFAPESLAFFAPESLALQVILYIAAFAVWAIFSMLAVASMLRRDRSKAEQLVVQQIEGLSGQVLKLEQGLDDVRADLRQKVKDFKDFEQTVRKTLEEELGVVLPPGTLSVRARAGLGSVTFNLAAVTVSGGSRVARLRQWFRRSVHRVCAIVYGRSENS